MAIDIWEIPDSDSSDASDTLDLDDDQLQDHHVQDKPVPDVYHAALTIDAHKDGFIDDEDEECEVDVVYHRSMSDLYPRRSLQLLRRSMGERDHEGQGIAPPKNKHLTQVQLSYHMQPLTKAGDLRLYIILGCRPTYPYHIVTCLSDRLSPFLELEVEKPRSPFSTSSMSVVYWTLDPLGRFIKPVRPTSNSSIPGPLWETIVRIDSAWDVTRDCLVQILYTHGIDYDESESCYTTFRYGHLETMGFEYIPSAAAMSTCFCGIGCADKRDISLKVLSSLYPAINLFFPYSGDMTAKLLGNRKYWRRTSQLLWQFSVIDWFLDFVNINYPQDARHCLDLCNFELYFLEIAVPAAPFSLRDGRKFWRSMYCAFLTKHRVANSTKSWVTYFSIDPRTAEVSPMGFKRLQTKAEWDEMRTKIIAQQHVCARRMPHLNFKMLERFEEASHGLKSIDMEEVGVTLMAEPDDGEVDYSD